VLLCWFILSVNKLTRVPENDAENDISSEERGCNRGLEMTAQ
jgi:hypothetical protein